MGTVAAATIGTAKLIAFGFCLGIGFWASKKLTNVADEYLLLWSEKRMKKVVKDTQDDLDAILNISDDVAAAATIPGVCP